VKSKILQKFHRLPFVFLVFLTSFFPISLIQTCQTILNIFVVLHYTDYRFYQRILENTWIFIKKKMVIFAIQNIFRVPSFTICFLIFWYFWHLFYLFYLSIVVKEILKNFCILFLYGFEILSKNSPKLWFFFKKLRYLKSKISTKFHSLLFHFYF